MLIGIDGNEANVEKKVGISEYAFELIREFKRIQGPTLNIQVYLKDKPRSEMPEKSENWKYLLVKPRKFWTQIGLPYYIYTHFPRPDVFFSPTHYAPRFSPVPTVISVMDLSYLHFPSLFAKKDLYQLTNWTKYSINNAKRILTISNFSRNDIIKTYRVIPGKVVTTYLGIKPESVNMNQNLSRKDLQTKFGINSNYILFVGTLQPRKNIVKLIQAFAKVKNKQSEIKDLQLVIVGKKGWLYEEILQEPGKLNIDNSVKFLDFVEDSDLHFFYKNAICFVLPSLYEGFGLPVVEAMNYGCPVITSNVSSLPEAGGDAAMYVNPESVNDIAEKIEKVLSSEKLRKEMIEKGYNQIKKFSWEKTARQTLKILEEVAKDK